MNRKILLVEWFTQGIPPHHFGIVVTQSEMGQKKAYIGNADGLHEETDAQSIADYGCKIYPEQLERVLKALKIQDSIKCPKCGMVSHNTNDIKEKYCGNCHQFHAFL